MGNCILRCKKCSCPEKEAKFESVAMKKPPLFPPDKDNSKLGGMKVKIVLTKEELQMLMDKLKNIQEDDEEGKKTLEDVLDEIERVRRRSVINVSSSSWKPSLESIAETEVTDH